MSFLGIAASLHIIQYAMYCIGARRAAAIDDRDSTIFLRAERIIRRGVADPWRILPRSVATVMLAPMSIVHIALGANLGRRKSNILAALNSIASTSNTQIISVASFHETLPVEAPQGSGPFINTAAAIDTLLDPHALLLQLLRIETELGRDRTRSSPLNSPRTIDLDLLLYGERIIDTPELQVPHLRMHERLFVLEPLVEIAPDAVHPVYHRTMQQLLDDLRASPRRPSAK